MVGSSSIYQDNQEKFGPASALTLERGKFWHSESGEKNPWISFEMSGAYAVLVVEVTDRQDMDCCYDRFENVEVTVGSSPDIKSPEKKTCGMKSHQEGGRTSYRYRVRPK